MRDKILDMLKKTEQEKGVRILFACEAGSRAWGFQSKDSDYDVRFIYAHDESWYIDIDRQKKDVIERMEEPLDFAGWELSKALRLFRKSNPPLLEWLHSPIVYIDKVGPGLWDLSAALKQILPEFYSPVSCIYHYFNMGKGNYREYLKGDEVWTKKYFYVLRPMLACKWIENNRTNTVPVDFETLVDAIDLPAGLRKSIDQLVENKRNGKELSIGRRINNIHAFIDNEMARLDKIDFKTIHSGKPDLKTQTKQLNKIFRQFIYQFGER